MGKIINYARIYYNWKMGRKTALGYAPEDISIELTNTCNFRCRYCLQSDPGHFKTVSRSNLSPDEARVLIRRLRDGGVKTNVMHWTLDGEPFINKNINEISSIRPISNLVIIIPKSYSPIISISRSYKLNPIVNIIRRSCSIAN